MAGLIVMLAGNSLVLTTVYSALADWVLGVAVTVTASYIISASRGQWAPLILAAEVYETAAPAEASPATDGHDHQHGTEAHGAEPWAPEDGWERNAYSLGAQLITGVGLAFLLTAAIVFFGKGADWRRGLLWGLAGFASFTLAPSIGLPPELPGTEAAPLLDRQLWWIGTVIATAGGLFAAARVRNVYGYAIAVVLIAAPHIIGAPQPEVPGALAPAELDGDLSGQTEWDKEEWEW